MPRLLHEVAVGRGDGSYTRLLTRLAKLDLLAIDDWLLAPLRDAERRDLVEVIEDRAERRDLVEVIEDRAELVASTLDAHRQSTPGPRLACGHRGSESSRRDL